MKTTVRETGTVKSWQGTYGFIQRDDNGTGQRVEFDIAESERGLKAVQVQVVE